MPSDVEGLAERTDILQQPQGGRVVYYWRLRWPGKDGRPRTESIGRVDEVTEAEATAIRRRKMVDIDTGKALRDRPGMTIGQYLDLDREALLSVVQPGTIKTHDHAKQRLIGAIGADVKLDKVEWHHVDRLINWLSQDHRINGKTRPACSRATVKQTIATLKAAFNRAKDRDLIVKNPFAKKGPTKIQAAQKRIFTTEEIAAMIETRPGLWWETFLRLALTSGLRLGELLNLTWSDIDEDGGQVIVSAKRAGTFEVAGAHYPVLPFSCKAHHERRVPLHTDAARLLRRLRLRAGGSLYVFLSLPRLARLGRRRDVRDGEQPPAASLVNNYLRDFKLIQAAAGLDSPGSIHDIRKSFGTHMAKHVPMHELQKLLGHASITTTADFYLDVSSNIIEQVRAAFGRTR